MPMKRSVRRLAVYPTRGLLHLIVLLLVAVPLAAQVPQVAGEKIRLTPSSVLDVPAAELRSVPDFEFFSAEAAEPVEIPFLPTMDPAEYERLKTQAGQEALWNTSRGMSSLAAEPGLLLAPMTNLNFEGLNELESGFAGFFLFPPDTHGAVGRTQFVEVVNTRVAVYNKSTGALLKALPLNTFFSYNPPGFFPPKFLADPRAVYDRAADRWIITAFATPESPTVQFFFIAVSKTGDATGDFFFYRVNVTLAPNDFWDFSQVGLDSNAVLFTANIFGLVSGQFQFKGAHLIVANKNQLYNGLPFSAPRFTELAGTLTPPIVLDNNPATFLIANLPPSPLVALYALTNSGDPATMALDVTAVNVGFYNVPRRAFQPGFFVTLDTLDTRFVNASTQIGDSLFNVHTISFMGFPTPRWYEINTASSVVADSGVFFAGDNSDDFNASIVANDNRDVFVTWTSTAQAPTRTNPAYPPQIRVSGHLSTEPSDMSPGSVVFESPFTWQQFPGRWGDYSAITLDPSNPTCAWGVNEKVNQPFIGWGSRFFRSCFP